MSKKKSIARFLIGETGHLGYKQEAVLIGETGHLGYKQEAAFIDAGTSSADSYTKAEPRL